MRIMNGVREHLKLPGGLGGKRRRHGVEEPRSATPTKAERREDFHRVKDQHIHHDHDPTHVQAPRHPED